LIGLCALAIGAPTSAAAAPSALPQGAIGQHLGDYVAAVSTGDPKATATFAAADLADDFDGRHAPAGLQPYFDNQRRVTGGITPVAFRFDPGSKVQGTFVFRDTIYGGLRALSFTFDASPAQKIRSLSPTPPPAWATASAAHASPRGVASYAIGLIERGCRADVFSGAFLVARYGRVLAEKACGDADKRSRTPNRVTTRFNLGSMSKMFTAVAIAQLMDQGRIRPTDHLGDYVDESWLPKAISARITIDQLLAMTSGLGSYFDDGPVGRFQMNRTLDAYKPVMRAEGLRASPGEKFIYSDTGYFLLGLVIQKASGEDYYDYLRRHIFLPAGMASTDSYELDQPREDLALGYAYVGGAFPWRENRSFVGLKGAPDGGGYSTVGDLLRFAEALKAGKLVSAASLKRLWSDHPPNHWGNGFYVFGTPAGPLVGKDGFGVGISSEMDIYPEAGYVVVALSNYGSGALAPMDAMRAEITRGGSAAVVRHERTLEVRQDPEAPCKPSV
jgi:CubicO group peptidase (beta-lactamase class C family)